SDEWAEVSATPKLTYNLIDVAADSNGNVFGASLLNANVKTMRATVIYDGNGQSSGAGTVPTDTRAYGVGEVATVLGAGSMTKTDLVFAGWATSPSATVAEYAPGDTINM